MKVLLDEDVPHLLRHELPGHEVYTVAYVGWSGVKNGVLLGLAVAAGFDVFVTCDRNLEHQQQVPALDLAVIVLAVPNTRIPTVLALASDIRAALAAGPRPGTLSVVGSWRVRGE